MFSFLNNNNDNNNDNIDLTHGKKLLKINENNENKLISNLHLISDSKNLGSIVEAMSEMESTERNNHANDANDANDVNNVNNLSNPKDDNISKLNNEFNRIMIEYIKNYQLLIDQVLKNQNNSILQKYAGKNVKLQGSNNEFFYVNKFGFLQKFKNFSKRPLSCSQEPIEIPPSDFIKLPKGEDMPAGVDCGLEGNNIKDKTTGEFSWINITGERFNYPKDIWDKRSISCKQASVKNINHSNIVGLSSSGVLKEDSMCNRLNADPKLLENVQKLNKKLTRLGGELLLNIGKISVKDIQSQIKINNTRREISNKLKELKKENEGLDNGDFKITSKLNPNLEELRLDTGFRLTSNFTKYIIFLLISILLFILTVYTLLGENENIFAQGVIGLVLIYGVYLFMKYIYNLIF
tara:strand:+ start:5016 stop:6239 length:1224 start_codon:yes stop_codon:yes gene_type:complete